MVRLSPDEQPQLPFSLTLPTLCQAHVLFAVLRNAPYTGNTRRFGATHEDVFEKRCGRLQFHRSRSLHSDEVETERHKGTEDVTFSPSSALQYLFPHFCIIFHSPANMMRLQTFALFALFVGSSIAAPAMGPHPNYMTTITTSIGGTPTTQIWTIDPPTGGAATAPVSTVVTSIFTSVPASTGVVSSFTSTVPESSGVVSSFTSIPAFTSIGASAGVSSSFTSVAESTGVVSSFTSVAQSTGVVSSFTSVPDSTGVVSSFAPVMTVVSA
ncbi:hypothetical protein C8T65DRAFT_679255 [Cerioporus squamosus]|nr:hypothetical protein C8T65DRAFT_679255 [Cerioporus squamosus]